MIVSGAGVEARITVGLPASGRTILGKEAEAIFFDELPEVVKGSLYHGNLDAGEVITHVDSVENQDFLRNQLKRRGLVAFVADAALLPRKSGIDDRSLGEEALPFRSPESLSVTISLPNAGDVPGMGVPEGVTLIVGGGFHGKSTLLHAIERGVYNHIPGDGRERVVAEPSAVKIRSEDGRSISDVDISPFIDNLPFGRDTVSFSTENASGSTSQATNIIEALQCGAKLLLIDEDTSATNFMIRDGRMQMLVSKEKEPITPFLHRVRELYEKEGVSTVIVMGGSGDYFSVSDTVIMMDAYEPGDVTAKARELAGSGPPMPDEAHIKPFTTQTGRKPEISRLDASRGKREVKIDAPVPNELLYGEQRIDLGGVEQLIDIAQTRAVGLMIHYYAKNCFNNSTSLIDGLEMLFREIEEKDLDIISPYKVGNLALPRLHEVAAAINRIRMKG